jgi:hypothetical protein
MKKIAILNVISFAALAYDSKVHYRNKKRHAEVLERNIKYQNMIASQQRQIAYLASMLDKHEVTMSEFDLIAFNNLI